MKLSREQWKRLVVALTDAFPTPDDFEEMFRYGLGRSIYELTKPDRVPRMAFEVIRTAEGQGWTAQLVLAAREVNPGNGLLLDAARELGLTSTNLSNIKLEKFVNESSKFLDPEKWRQSLWQVETRVCRIEIKPLSMFGTGFLLGPDVVMTNYHVIEPLIQGPKAKPADVILCFDYRRLADGMAVQGCTEYRLTDPNWLIDSSPPSPVDNVADPKPSMPQPDQLDYALLRLAHPAGSEPVGGPERKDAATRGWIQAPGAPYEFTVGSPLFIMQHPKGDPLQLALDTEAIQQVNGNGTRVRYRTNTLPGSSGSPCFNADWELVALHHSGDPEYQATYNEGIPFSSILTLLEGRGLREELGEQ